MPAPLCPDCQRPMLFKWDLGQFVCAWCRYTAEERFADLLRLGSSGGINWVDRLKMKFSIDAALEGARPRVTLT
jgi:hypothetical protein